MTSCAVKLCKNCASKDKKDSGISFHIFPTDPVISEAWTKAIQKSRQDSMWKPSKRTLICSAHFEKNNFHTTKLGLRRLRKGSIPTKDLWYDHIINDDDPLVSLRNNETKMNLSEKMDTLEGTTTQEKLSNLECRACLKYNDESRETNVFFDLFRPWKEPWDGMGSTVADDLMKLADITVNKDDNLSKVICLSCYNRLHDACDFFNLVKKNDLMKKHTNILNNMKTAWPQPIQLEKPFASEDTKMDESNLVTIKEEVVSDDEVAGTCQVDEMNEIEIKVEPEEIVLTPKQFQERANGLLNSEEIKADGKFSDLPSVLNGESAVSKDIETRIKEEPIDEDENFEFYSDLPLECMLCTKGFKSILGLKAHVIAQHSYKTVKRKSSNLNSPDKKNGRKHYCKICNRSFVTSTDLMVHETCHNKAICYACNQQFDTFKDLTKHRRNCNKIDANNAVKPKGLKDVKRVPLEIEVPIEDNKTIEPVNKLVCPKCNEVFTGSYYLNIHQEIHHNSTIQHQVSLSEAPIDLKQHDDLLLQSIFGVAK